MFDFLVLIRLISESGVAEAKAGNVDRAKEAEEEDAAFVRHKHGTARD